MPISLISDPSLVTAMADHVGRAAVVTSSRERRPDRHFQLAAGQHRVHHLEVVEF
jgi:hypothetical protein